VRDVRDIFGVNETPVSAELGSKGVCFHFIGGGKEGVGQGWKNTYQKRLVPF
jgi:hypothetical protein